ncbi:MAG TPA: DUF1236 domain-containing protein, partial [Chloroflexota bacterium]|nr:DUF1236 domain-containing protein [Chloroflexota bacterium]
ITFATALLASTALAFAQGASERKDRAQPGTSPPAATQGQPAQPKSKGVQPAPSTSGQAQERREQGPKGAQGPAPRTPDQNRTEGQNQREQPRTQGQAPRDQGQTRTPGQAQPTPVPGQNPPGRTQGQAEPRGGGSVTLTSEQRTKIRQTVIEGRNAPRVGKVDFALNVGTVVPRTVHVVEVPETIVEIHPEWRRFLYFVYNDQIVIVEPRTLKIVAVLDV